MTTPHIVTAEHAEQVWGWLQERGGIACWQSVNLSNPGASWTTPRRTADGAEVTKPTWQAEERPSRIITNQPRSWSRRMWRSSGSGWLCVVALRA